MGSGPYSLGSEILRSAVHAPVPSTVEDVKKYIYVLECEDGEKWGWRGEWLDQFPKFRTLSAEDMSAWNKWIASSDIQAYLQETIVKCQRLSDLSLRASGFARFTSI